MDRLEELEYTIFLNCKKNYESIAQYGYLASIYTSIAESPDDLKRLWRIVDEMGKHSDPLIRVILIMQLPKLALVGEEKDHDVCTQWRLILEYLVDANDKIRKSTQLVLLFFMKKSLLDEDVVEKYFCPAVNQACAIFADTVDALKVIVKCLNKGAYHSHFDDLGHCLDIFSTFIAFKSGVLAENWQQPSQLMYQMAPLVGKEMCEKHFLKRFIDLCSREESSIRENCVRNFSIMCFSVTSESAESLLLPVFIKLCHDPLACIRSACIDVFVLVACLFTMEKRKNELTSAFSDLLADSSKSCRCSAYRILGAFMCTFAEHAMAELFANDRFENEYGVCSRNVGSVSSHLQLLKTENPSAVFSKAYIEELFPSFCANQAPAPKEIMRSPFGIFFPLFDDSGQFADPEPEKVDISDLKLCLLDGHGEECNKEGEELDEFNSFRFWQMPLGEIESFPECESGPDERAWNQPESKEEEPKFNEEVFELHRSVLLNSISLDTDWNSEPEFLDILFSDGQALTPLDAVEEEACPFDEEPLPEQDVMPQILLKHFISMGNQSRFSKNAIIDDERAQFCASWLPAVALTLGPGNWSQIRDTHRNLTSLDFHWKVRRTIASSMHELASILGEEVTATDLSPILKDLLMDSDDVANSALQHLADFCKYLVPENRLRLLSLLVNQFLNKCALQNWRNMEEMMNQLRLSIKLFTPEDCFQHFVPVANTHLSSKIAFVRYKAVELMSDLIENLKDDTGFLSSLVKKLLGEYASHSAWRRRQTFVLLCSHIASRKMLDSELFSNLFLDQLLKLSKDSVPNVVLCTARCLSLNIIKNDYISRDNPHFGSVINVLKELETDKDRDVRYFASLYEESDVEE